MTLCNNLSQKRRVGVFSRDYGSSKVPAVYTLPENLSWHFWLKFRQTKVTRAVLAIAYFDPIVKVHDACTTHRSFA